MIPEMDKYYLCTGPDILHSPRTCSHGPPQCQQRPPPPPPPPPPVVLPEDSPEPGCSVDTPAVSPGRNLRRPEGSRSRELDHHEVDQRTELGSRLRAGRSRSTQSCSGPSLLTFLSSKYSPNKRHNLFGWNLLAWRFLSSVPRNQLPEDTDCSAS